MKMKALFQVLVLALFFTACDKNNNVVSPNGVPVVQSATTYDVTMEEGITYGEGLSHQSWNDNMTTTMELKLDAFVPDNDLENRPAIMLIHGGGFVGGTRTQDAMVHMAQYFAERGWVAFSIDYRLKDDYGTVPSEWIDSSSSLDPSLADQFLAMYPAHRDAKAALRWIVANAETYNINTGYLTVGGGSAGAITSVGIPLA